MALNCCTLYPILECPVYKYLLGKKTGLWVAVRKDVSITYAEMFTENELKQLTAFFKSGVGKKWIDSQEEFFRKSQLSFQNNESHIRQIAVLGCVTAILLPNMEQAKKKAGITEEGIPPAILPMLVYTLRRSAEPANEGCRLKGIILHPILIDYPPRQPFDRQRTKSRCENNHIQKV